MICLGH